MSRFRQWFRRWRFGRRCARLGRGVQFRGSRLEIKGHVEFGDRCVIKENVALRTHKGGKLLFGDDVEIGDNTLVQCNGTLNVGAGACISEHCVIRDTNHVMRGTDIHWRLTPHITEPITIGPNAYIGAHVYVGPGVTIGEGAVIGPGSVIGKNVGPYEIWAGYPASFIAHRTDRTRQTSLKRRLDLVAMFGVKDEANEPQHP